MVTDGDVAVGILICSIFASIAHLVECPLTEQEVVGSNPMKVVNGTSSSLADARIKRGCARKIE